ncbi:Catechol 2,3-dioxygenase [Chryseobacterium taeanense]|uniref:Catechol 2,3-dioxygenase n=1 Tax=Chryseobacterium taeanense TaxID=311334 RepID=A0A1G8KDE6_9FLAO|nr:VOC family protein [Chryseobacterium taeanense]SDI41389.1 Catechol 2,3-dioxygenase [Chryseobacterium taeanense]
MNLLSIRIITADMERLVAFYKQITGLQIVQYTPDFAELKTPTTTFAIGSTKTLQFFGGEDVAQPAQNRTVIIEFKVDDVDKEFQRLSDYLQENIVQKPTMMPWGNKSFLFRDPDGNLVNFFTPATPEAIAKFSEK